MALVPAWLPISGGWSAASAPALATSAWWRRLHAGLGRPPRQLLSRRTDGGAENPRPWRRRAGRDDRLLRRSNGPAAVHAHQLPALAVDFEGTGAATSGPARRTCWARSPTTWNSQAGAPTRHGVKRLMCRLMWTHSAGMPNVRYRSGHERASTRSVADGPHGRYAGWIVVPDGAERRLRRVR